MRGKEILNATETGHHKAAEIVLPSEIILQGTNWQFGTLRKEKKAFSSTMWRCLEENGEDDHRFLSMVKRNAFQWRWRLPKHSTEITYWLTSFRINSWRFIWSKVWRIYIIYLMMMTKCLGRYALIDIFKTKDLFSQSTKCKSINQYQ